MRSGTRFLVDDISFLNSGDIASMGVLNDASTTAIYGLRGANGVILIQAKTGILGQERPLFSFSAEYGVQQLSKKIELLSGRECAV